MRVARKKSWWDRSSATTAEQSSPKLLLLALLQDLHLQDDSHDRAPTRKLGAFAEDSRNILTWIPRSSGLSGCFLSSAAGQGCWRTSFYGLFYRWVPRDTLEHRLLPRRPKAAATSSATLVRSHTGSELPIFAGISWAARSPPARAEDRVIK